MNEATHTQTKSNTKGAPPPAAPDAKEMTPVGPTAIEVFDYGEDAGQGFENQDMSDRKLPMIVLLQSNSPKVVESRGKIAPGSFMNSVTGEIFEEVTFVPGVTDHCFTSWISRDDGGGFRGRYAKDAKVVAQMIARNDGRNIGKIPFPQLDAAGKPKLDPKGKPEPVQELVESYEVYCILYKGAEIIGFAVIPFTSAKIKVYRGWNSQIRDFSPTIGGKKIPTGKIPLFAHRVRMTSESDSNAKGTFFVPVLSPAEGGDDLVTSLLPKTDPRYLAAKQLHDQVIAGLAKAAWETTEQDAPADPEAAAPF